MRKLKLLLLTCVFIISLQGIAAATPTIIFTIGGTSIYQTLTLTSTGLYTFSGTVSSSGASLTNFWITVKTDPYIAYGFTAVNNTAITKDFGFDFLPGVAFNPPLTGATTIRASIFGGITDNNDDGVSIAPYNQAAIQINYTDEGTANEFSWSVGPADSKGPQAGFGSFPYVGEVLAAAPGPFAPVMFGEAVHFTLTPGDIASLTGYCYITAPIPGSLLLLGSGLLGLLAIGRRNRKS
jgi:hypothetical protein